MVHKPFHGLHGAALAAEVIKLRVSAFRLIPRHEGKALTRLPLLKTWHVAQDQHPPMVRTAFFSSANVAGERYIPNHGYPHLSSKE